MEIRYLGFEQRQNARAYQFDVVEKGEPSKRFIVEADLSLFRANGVLIQEGLSLCSSKLVSDLEKELCRAPRAYRRGFARVRECPLPRGSKTGRDAQDPAAASVGARGTNSLERL